MRTIIQNSRFWLWSGLLFLCACGELERNNPLDPKNPRSERPRVIFVEAFVNDATPFSPFALRALDSLSLALASDQIIIVEHHLPSANYNDSYALQESADRYNNLAAADPGVPDVFFNGTLARLQGASSAHTAAQRYRAALQNESGKIAYFTLEAKKSIAETGIEINATIARLGDSPASQFAVTAVVWEDLGLAGHRHVVRKVFSPEAVNGLAAGDTRTVRFATNLTGVQNANRVQAAVLIERNLTSGREVLQAALAE
ncbi:hypothetical protein EDS67_14110 [candidate division KSB1 bacterium]|nr:MAG: hypothetical protein EDS67_14110 [candidate division KSB1 bacterium]MBC6949431.1 hypothetical protein [candidate division KSB1 bacterium]MCE7941096.1 hypothetical protein [Chlorobi bacterium CHB1]MDL1876815.1 hypothetical protein [Cytophagia bacterium CHB2]